MTISEPLQAGYLDEKSARDEFTRVATVCNDCRRCVEFCGSFPTLFDLIEQTTAAEAGGLTPAQQDLVGDGCFQCGRCVSNCPYSPGLHELAVDVPHLVLRMAAMRHATGQIPVRARATSWMMRRGGLVARIARARAGSIRRRAAATVSDLSTTRLIPPYVRPTFSTWFEQRAPRAIPPVDGSHRVTVFPTCIVEHQAPHIGAALVDVYERQGVSCSLSSVGCCGAPLLHAGDVGRFRKIAARNVDAFAVEVRRDGHVVVPQPTCLQVITEEYPRHLGSQEAGAVAGCVESATGYLMRLQRSGAIRLDLDPGGEIPRRIAYHETHRSAEGSSAPDLLSLTGAEVISVDRSAGTGVTWGWRAPHEVRSRAAAGRLAAALADVGADAVVSECHDTSTAIFEATGVMPQHPLEMVARTERSDAAAGDR